MQLIHRPPVHLMNMVQSESINQALLLAFEREINSQHVRRSHFELGRYENIYIDRSATPEIEVLIETALKAATEILGQNNLKVGYWFNAMQPGQRTLRHNHDEEDELLSCVYYVCAAENSGDLLIQQPGGDLKIKPEAGKFVFFSPKLAHEVEENRSKQRRLSIAFNFGDAKYGLND